MDVLTAYEQSLLVVSRWPKLTLPLSEKVFPETATSLLNFIS